MPTDSYAAAAHHASSDATPTPKPKPSESKPHAHFDETAQGHEHDAKHHIHARAGDALLHRGEMDQAEVRRASR